MTLNNMNKIKNYSETNIDSENVEIKGISVHNVSFEDFEASTTISILSEEQQIDPLTMPSTSSKSLNKKNYGNLPTTYSLPFIDNNSKLGIALKNKVQLNKSLKSDFLNKIFESFSSKKKFYIDCGYTEITNAILNSYPYLGNGLGYESAQHLWHNTLTSKFANERARDKSSDFVRKQCTRTKIEKVPLSTAVPCSSKSIWWGIPNYKPDDEVYDEDQFSIDNHKTWLEKEFGKTERNEKSISLRMDATFKNRRNLLFSDQQVDILQHYPCLKLENQAILEVSRLFGINDKKYKLYSLHVKEFSIALNDFVTKSKSKYASHMNNLFGAGNFSKVNDYMLFKLIGNVSLVLGEDPKEIIATTLNEKHGPMLLVLENGSVELNVDGRSYIASITAINASFLWLASFYFFNIRPMCNYKTFNILQLLFFNIPEKPKLNQGLLEVKGIWDDIITKCGIDC